MSNKVVQELNNSHSPEAYVSGFTFFKNPIKRKAIAEFEPQCLCALFYDCPDKKTQYIHELWRTGRLEVVYGFFNLSAYPQESIGDIRYPSNQLPEDDVIRNTSLMMKEGGVSQEESFSFLYDLLCAAANAHDGQQFGEDPLYPEDVTQRVLSIMREVEQRSNIPQVEINQDIS